MPADPVAAGVGEGALHMAEQLAFEQILGDRAEIDRDQDLVGAARAAVELARDQLLAGAVLAEDEDVGLGRPGALDQRPDPRHRRRIAEQGRLAAGGGRGDRDGALRSVTASARDVRSAAAVRTVASSRSFDQGLETKSVAPRFIASTATPIPAWAVIITTTACGSRFKISPSQRKPSAASVAPRPKLASSRIDVGQLGVHRRQRLVGRLEGGDLGEQVAQQQPRRQEDVGIVVDDDAAPEALRLIHGEPSRDCSIMDNQGPCQCPRRGRGGAGAGRDAARREKCADFRHFLQLARLVLGLAASGVSRFRRVKMDKFEAFAFAVGFIATGFLTFVASMPIV